MKAKLITAAVATALVWIAWVAVPHAALLLGLILAVLFGLAAWASLPQRRLSANRVRYQRFRLAFGLHPGKGFSTAPGLFFRFGRFKMFAQSHRIRPDLPFWYRLRNPDAYSTLVGRAHRRIKARVSHQVHVLLLSVPRTGKTGWLARAILHHPGAVISTSSQPDVFRLTSGARARRGRVHVLNPSGLGGVESTFRWDLLSGCHDEQAAIRRADALINAVPAGGADGADWFKAKASDAMRALLIAGAISGSDFRSVSNWILAGRLPEAIDILREAGHLNFAATLAELTGKAEKTASTVLMFMSRAIQFAVDPALLASVLPGEGDGLDLETLLRNGETLYLIAPVNGDDSPLAGLFSALVGEVHHTARQVAATMPGGRLAPCALYALDELCQTAPIPAASWAADAGGRGVQLILVAHGQAQLEARYGKAQARSILDCASAKVVFGGISDADTLTLLEKICGQVALREHGHDSHARHPIISTEMIRELPDGYALLVSGNSAPVIVKPPMCWKDRAYRWLKRRGEAVARLTAAPPPRPLTEQVAPETALVASLPSVQMNGGNR